MISLLCLSIYFIIWILYSLWINIWIISILELLPKTTAMNTRCFCVCTDSCRHREIMKFLAHRECLISTSMKHIELISKMDVLIYNQWIFQLWKSIRFSYFHYAKVSVVAPPPFFGILWFYSWSGVSEWVSECLFRIVASLCLWMFGHTSRVY